MNYKSSCPSKELYFSMLLGQESKFEDVDRFDEYFAIKKSPSEMYS